MFDLEIYVKYLNVKDCIFLDAFSIEKYKKNVIDDQLKKCSLKKYNNYHKYNNNLKKINFLFKKKLKLF